MITRETLISLFAVLIGIFCITCIASASTEADALLMLLVKKGLVTEQEAEQLKAEVKKEAVNKPVAVTSSKPVKSIRLGGKLEVRYEDSQSEEPSFKMANFEPNITVEADEHFCMKGQLECTTDTAFVNEAYAMYKDMSGIKGDAQAGKFRRKSFGFPQADNDRISVDYSLLGRAFTGERQLGAEYNRSLERIGPLGPVKLAMGIFNGGDVGNRKAGDNAKKQVLFVADRAGDADDTQNKEFSFRSTIEPVKGLQIGSSILTGKLSTADISNLNTYLSTSYANRKKQRFGGDVTYKLSSVPLELRYEYIYGKTSDLNIDSWCAMGILGCIENKLKLYTRYSQLKPDIASTSSSYTWDLEQVTLGTVWNFNKVTRLQAEYEFNEEEPPAGTSKVDNNMLRVEWQTDF